MPQIKRCDAAACKENQSPNESISPDESNGKMLKKESFLRDYEIQVKERVRSMENQLKKIMADLTRMATTEKLKINKKIRSMTIKEFLEKGGDLDTLDFGELSTSITADVSFRSPLANDAVTTSMQNAYGNVSTTTTVKRVVRPKREAPPDSSLVRHAIRNTRSRKIDLATPLHQGKQRLPSKQQLLVTPMVTPKFDLSKPLTAAREPIHGETLISLRGSPVVRSRADNTDNESNLVSISLMAQQTVLGGRLFLDEGMSPNAVLNRKQIIEEAVIAINSRLEELNSQISAGSKLDES